MRVLLTGAAGFIGLYTLRALGAAGHSVVAVDDFSRGSDDAEFLEAVETAGGTSIAVDLSAETAWKEIEGSFDCVVHLAAINGTRHFYERPFDVLATNIGLTVNLLRWHREASPAARIVFTSSSEVYAGVRGVPLPTPEDIAVGVDDLSNVRWSYGISKIAGESMIHGYASQTGSRFTIIRPHNIYGPRMGHEHVIPEFIARIESGESPFRIYGGENTRAFCYITDFVGGLILAIEREAAEGATINLGNDAEEVTMVDLARRLFAIVGVSPELDVSEAPHGSVMRRCPDLSRAREALGYTPSVLLDEGLRLTYESYVEPRWAGEKT